MSKWQTIINSVFFVENRWGRCAIIAAGPLWLPFYWLLQLVFASLGVSYYLVVERTQAVVLGRAINRTRVRVRWYYVPFVIVALPFALILQLLFELSSFIVWWHRCLARWQWGTDRGVAAAIAAIVFELTFILVFVGSYYHPLAWMLTGRELLDTWYREEGETLRRVLLGGPALFGVVVLLIVPTLAIAAKASRFRRDMFYPCQLAALVALYTALLSENRFFNDLWLGLSQLALIVLVLVGLMLLARRVVHGNSTWRQFVWFTAVSLLEKKRIAMFSLVAVSLCTAMLLIIVSIMSGFVEQIREKTHGLVGDIIIQGDPVRGFPHYEGFLARLATKPITDTVAVATPAIQTVGLFRVANPRDPENDSWTRTVRVNGIILGKKIAVSDFGQALERYKTDPAAVLLDERINSPWVGKDEEVTGLIHGLEMLAWRDKVGRYDRFLDERDWPCTVTVLPVTKQGRLDRMDPLTIKKFCIVDDSRTGVYEIDSYDVYVGFDILQELLDMQYEPPEEEFAGQQARTHEIQIKLRPGIDLYDGREIVRAQWEQYHRDLAAKMQDDVLLYHVQVRTWEEVNAKLISAVENEKRLMVILVGVISIVAVFLILCIFYMIVVEKTRDIGILKSIGASEVQIGSIFLAYAAVIGVVGSLLGAALGAWFVHRINEFEAMLINVFGWRVWNREVYSFDQIPNQIDPDEAIMIIIVAISASIIGAIIPAIRAAKMHPVEALRYE